MVKKKKLFNKEKEIMASTSILCKGYAWKRSNSSLECLNLNPISAVVSTFSDGSTIVNCPFADWREDHYGVIETLSCRALNKVKDSLSLKDSRCFQYNECIYKKPYTRKKNR